MDIEHEPHSKAADAELDRSLNSPICHRHEEPADDRRQMRIADYEHLCLEHPDPLVASVGALNADLLTLAQRVGGVLNQALAELGTVGTVTELAPVLNTFQSITRQIGRYAEFEQRAARAAEELETLKAAVKKNALRGTSPAAPQSLATSRNPWRSAR
jgi:hypothetical protein